MNADDASLRLSHDEREAAVSRLEESARRGRLDDDELEERRRAALAAKTRGDLAPLFEDLPDDSAAARPAPEAGLPARRFAAGNVVVALMPFLALILFFATGDLLGYQYAWLWFLLVPIAWIVVHGADADHRR